MANHEDYLDALTAFGSDASKEIPPVLEQYLNGVAKNGETLFQWPLLKPLIVGKMEQVIEELQRGLSSENITSRPNVENVRFDVMRTRIMDAVHKFTGAPFTIQRLCELLVDPRRHYKRSDKFMRGLEKNVLVVSTVDPFGRKVVSEAGNKHLVNGMDNGIPIFSRDSGLSSNLPPVPGWVTTPVTTTSRAQDSPEKMDPQETSLTTNGVASSLVTPVFGDHGDQTPAVHAEEVVETAVSLEAGEAGPEATGAGEALADEEEEDMGTEDTNASTSSSSSSSSEDLSNPDIGESSATLSAPPSAVISSSSEPSDSRPWAAIAAEGENKQKDQSMDLESKEPTPDTSKNYDSENQDTKLTASQSLLSTSSVSDGSGCQSPMDTTASTSSHIGPPADTDNQAVEICSARQESDSVVQDLDRPEDSADITETFHARESGQDIPSSSSSLPNASASETEAEITPLYADDRSDQQQVSDGKDQGGVDKNEEIDPVVESLPSAAVVSSSETSSSLPSGQVTSRDVTSSNHQELVEASDEPQAKHRRLSGDFQPSSSPSNPNTQDLEPSSSSLECPDREASSSEEVWPAMTTVSSAADTTATVSSHSPSATKTDLDSTTDNSTCVLNQEPSDLEKQASNVEVGGGDGDMPQSTQREDRTDLGGNNFKTLVNSSSLVDQDMKDQISSDATKTSLASQPEPSKNGSYEEPMEQD
ncbi:serine/threonine-protein phosphatase 4 regulatory subunit 2 [Elysia marginata]|uniref:Serine/threonine-protein phosphatase 4 regulatory subunit 2 n=1 Tax=Elysia marginata TaxID=1093978 RepID=A0AAV4EQK6_9GAST|nr:serine/threonine-protein phosphatase 4 regulatory subunit 2 [Elysia marginata]